MSQPSHRVVTEPAYLPPHIFDALSKDTMRTAITMFSLLAALGAQAQTPQASPPDSEAPASTGPTSEERIDTLSGRLDSLEEQYAETKTSVLSLQRLKLSGYVQGRFQVAENTGSGLDPRGAPRVKDGFSVRRGRLKATYTADIAQLVLQIDATPRGVSLKDAEVHLISPWKGPKLDLVVGQTKWPFGYEVLQSSSEREFPERTRVVRAFAPGERDRGAKLQLKHGLLRATLGVFDGNGTDNRSFIGVDNDTEKDLVGRVGVDLGWLAGGVSGWAGKTFRTGDASGPGRFFARNRIGADAQLYLDLLPIGGTAVKGEFIAGTTYQRDGVEQFGQTGMGWYGLVVQNVGLYNEVGIRYDHFDGFTGTANVADPADPTKPASTNSVGTLGFVVAHHFGEHLKLTAAYEIPMTATGDQATDPDDNLFTLQFQAKF